ncbi:MAG: metal ABC transporter permease [Actinomycetota bacterium]|nr:metal ABC transporter permease [Actinomycetota bacterium]
MTALLDFDFMRRALVAAALVGLIAPLIGVFLVQRRLALLGDGMGHVALTGVGLAFLLGTAPIPTAMATAVAGAFLIEFIRYRSRTAGDVALALLFYGGIAGGVMLASLAPGRASSSLNAYLFGSLSTVAEADLLALGVLCLVVVAVVAVLGREMFSVSLDPDLAAVQGIRVRAMSTLMAVLAAVVVVVGMRVVGLLLVSAIMIVPVAAAQQVTRSFRGTAILAIVIGLAASLAGLVGSFYVEVPPGPTIVLVALAGFAVMAMLAVPIRRRRREPA